MLQSYVNNAGAEQDGTPLPEQTEVTYNRIMDINVIRNMVVHDVANGAGW